MGLFPIIAQCGLITAIACYKVSVLPYLSSPFILFFNVAKLSFSVLRT